MRPPRRLIKLLAVGVCAPACVIAVAHAVLAPAVFFPVYLAAVFAVSAVPVGCLFVLMLSCLVGGAWAGALRKPLELGAASMPLIGLAFLPVFVGLPLIYPWSRMPIEAAMPAFKQAWLSPGFFMVRTVAVVLAFSAIAFALQRTRDESRRATIASGGLIVFALLASFAGIDWGMSVEPQFHSSIYGLIYIGGAILSGLSFVLIVALWTAREDAGHKAFGALLVSAILLWAYFHAMQYLVIWSANIPSEADWYLRRAQGGWGMLMWIVALGQFALPFLALLLRRLRRSTTLLIAVAVLSLAMRFLEAAWLILPPMNLTGPWPPMLFSALSLGLSALALTFALWWQDRMAGRRFPRQPVGAQANRAA